MRPLIRVDRLLCPMENRDVYSDCHLHLADLADRGADFTGTSIPPGWMGAAVAHDPGEFERSERLRSVLPPTVAVFGIHPQAVADRSYSADTGEPRLETIEDFLIELAASGRIRCVGETGFDFFGDRPGRYRTAESLAAQRRAFEFQIGIARRYNLALLVHTRKATDLLMGYTKELAGLRAVIFHSWPGRLSEAKLFLERKVRAYFSFGTPILRDAPHALESCSGLPESTILAETDAPWQPPRGKPWTGIGDIVEVTDRIASYRMMSAEGTRDLLRENFLAAFGEKE